MCVCVCLGGGGGGGGEMNSCLLCVDKEGNLVTRVQDGGGLCYQDGVSSWLPGLVVRQLSQCSS